jgi:hypothetical protein
MRDTRDWCFFSASLTERPPHRANPVCMRFSGTITNHFAFARVVISILRSRQLLCVTRIALRDRNGDLDFVNTANEEQ